jgi:hypothetical protein
MSLKAAELESLFTADISHFEKGATQVETTQKKLDGTVAEVKVEADVNSALASMDRVESAARSIPDGEMEVEADVNSALASMDRVESAARSIPDGEMEVTADISQAEGALGDLGSQAREGGSEAGEEAGDNLAGGIIAAIATIPVAGAIVGIGVAIGAALLSGLQNEVREDRLMATTGLDPTTVGRLARAAGEAYASNFGESIAGNMEIAQQAVQSGLLDPESTRRDAQSVIQSLAGVADILGEDVSRVARSTTQLLRTGLAATAQDAFDIIVKGQQAGLNVSEDWLDTLDEYSTMFRSLGLTGPQAMGLMSQAVRAGARDTDTAADALKEFQIRATDASTTSAEGFRLLGLDAVAMTAQIAAGGEGASAGLGLVLDRLREIEDPVARNTAAVALFGTKAEDLAGAFNGMDLSTAVEQLGAVEGAAQSALDTMGDNAAGDIESAKRNIEVAADGIKGALAAAFNPQIEDFATWISSNREQVMRFLLDMANGGLDAGRMFVEFTATSTEAIGGFIGGPLADLADAIAGILDGMSFAGLGIPGAQGAAGDLRGFADGMREVRDTTHEVADDIRTNLIENGLDPAQQRLNDLAIPLIAEAALHDSAMRLAGDIDGVGYAADGAKLGLEGLDVANLTTSESGTMLADQLAAVRDGLLEQIEKGQEAGLTQAELTTQYGESRLALLDQLTAMGLTQEQAEALIATYDIVPDRIDTVVTADTSTATAEIDRWVVTQTDRRVPITFYSNGPGLTPYVTGYALGDIVPAMATGDIMEPLPPGAQMVSPGRLRAVTGDRLDVDELYAPLDGSARSWSLLMEGFRRMPGVAPMADGAIVGTPSSGSSLVGLVLEGTLDLGGGLTGKISAMVKDVLDDVGSSMAYRGRA